MKGVFIINTFKPTEIIHIIINGLIWYTSHRSAYSLIDLFGYLPRDGIQYNINWGLSGLSSFVSLSRLPGVSEGGGA